jgi:hypothetical protein
MPKGVYERTEAHRASARRGLEKAHSPESRAKAQVTIQENGIRVGTKPGTKFSDEHRQALSEAHKGKSSRGTGFHHSEESKEKNRQAHLGKKASEETKQKLRDSFTDERREIHRRTKLGKKQSPETVLKRMKTFEERGFVPGILGNYVTIYNDRQFRSGLEAIVAEMLDKCDIQWEYEPKRFVLSWTTYCPDFYLPEFDIWLEVKGWEQDRPMRKVDSFRKETGKTLVLVRDSEARKLWKGMK